MRRGGVQRGGARTEPDQMAVYGPWGVGSHGGQPCVPTRIGREPDECTQGLVGPYIPGSRLSVWGVRRAESRAHVCSDSFLIGQATGGAWAIPTGSMGLAPSGSPRLPLYY